MNVIIKIVVILMISTKIWNSVANAKCECTRFINVHGYGMCRKETPRRYFTRSCYVDLPSTCKQLIQSKTNPEKMFSGEPCIDATEAIINDRLNNPETINALKGKEDKKQSQETSNIFLIYILSILLTISIIITIIILVLKFTPLGKTLSTSPYVSTYIPFPLDYGF